MARPHIMGRDLIEAGLKPGPDFTAILDYAHKLRLAGVDKDTALRQTLGEWNMVALAGAYGIYEELGQLYHKYNVVVRAQEDLDDVVADVLAGVFMATEEMSRRLVEAVRLSSGETDMEEIPEEE